MTNKISASVRSNDGNVVADASHTCLLLEAYRNIPTGARFTAMRMEGKSIVVRSASDVLVCVCKRLCLHHSSSLQSVIRQKQVNWIKTTRRGMTRPYAVSFNCYLEQDGSGNTPLLRAAKLLEWLAWPRADVSITYLDPASAPKSVSPKPISSATRKTCTKPLSQSSDEAPLTITRQKSDPAEVDAAETHLASTCHIEQLLEPSAVYGKRAAHIDIEGCKYKVSNWTECFNVFVSHCFDYHQTDLTRFNWSAGWRNNGWPVVRRVYPGPTRYEVLPTTITDAIKLIAAMRMIRGACNIRAADVTITCLIKNPESKQKADSIVEADKKNADEATSMGDEVKTFSYKFDHVDAVTGTDPVALRIRGKEYSLDRKWTNLPEKVCAALEEMWPGQIRKIVAKGEIACLALSNKSMRRGHYIEGSKVWLEKNCASREFIRQTRNLIRLFGVDLETVSLTYVSKGASIPAVQTPVMSAQENQAGNASPELEEQNQAVEVAYDGDAIDYAHLFADVPPENLVRHVVLELLKRGMDGGELWANLQNLAWCRKELGIRNALLRKLKIWESAGEYSQTYSILDKLEYENYLILKYLTGLKVDAFVQSVGEVGLLLGDVCKLFEIKPPEAQKPQPEEPVQVAQPEPTYTHNAESEPVSQTVHEPEAEYFHDWRSSEIKTYVEKHPGCAKQQAISDLSDAGVSRALNRIDQHPDVIDIDERLYVKESIYGFDEAAEVISDALESLFAANGGYTSAHELYQTVQVKLDDFFYDNDAFESERQVFDIAAYIFGKMRYRGKTYVFRGNIHIWREQPDYPMADAGLLIHWARLNGGILTRQLGYDNLERRGAMGPGKTAIFTLALDKVKDKFWVLSSEEFLLKEGLDVSVEFVSDLKRNLDKLLAIVESEDGYSFIPMGLIGDDFFMGLPPLPGGRPWSLLLLQSVIGDYTETLHYKTIARSSFSGQAHAAIVPFGSECQDYSDLVYAAIKARNNKPQISFGRSQFIDFLKASGLYPEDMAGSSLENSFKNNIHFKWLDRNSLVVV